MANEVGRRAQGQCAELCGVSERYPLAALISRARARLLVFAWWNRGGKTVDRLQYVARLVIGSRTFLPHDGIHAVEVFKM